MELVPQTDRIFVVPENAETVSRGGIIIPDTAYKEKPLVGTVAALGAGKISYDGTKRTPMNELICDPKTKVAIEVGSRILYASHVGIPVVVEDDDGKSLRFQVIRSDDVYALIVSNGRGSGKGKQNGKA